MPFDLLVVIFSPILCGGLLLFFPHERRNLAGWISFFPPLIATVAGLLLWQSSYNQEPVVYPISWLPNLNIDANLRVDRIASFFVMLIGFIGLAVVQYSRHYFKAGVAPFYWGTLMIFIGGMLGIVLADSLIFAFIFWELTTITSALLIGFNPEDPVSRRGATQAFLVTGAGGLSLLCGILILGQMTGTYNLSELTTLAPGLIANPFHFVPLLLICTGAFAKSAQWPLHFWLPGAMAAPAPISAYLHSATMVNAGVFLLGRFVPIFGDSPLWYPLLTTVGLTTFLMGSWLAFRSPDLKGLLAYTTVAYLGVLTSIYAVADENSGKGEILHFLNHALYKSSLFLLLGWFEKIAGTREISRLDDEYWLPRKPIGAALFGIGAIAMAGGPFLLGFQSKTLFYEQVLGEPGIPMLFAFMAFAGSVLTVSVALKLFVAPFWGKREPRQIHDAPAWLLVVPCILLLPQVIGGIFPGWFIGDLVEPASEWAGGYSFWLHVDMETSLKVLTFALGGGLYFTWRKISRRPSFEFSALAIKGITRVSLAFSTALGNILQAGGHSRFVAASLAVGLLGVFFLIPELCAPDISIRDSSALLGFLPCAMTVAGAIGVVAAEDRFTKILLMAFAGYGLAIFYILYRAPDLALTQILVETLSLILLLLAFRRLPALGRDRRSFPAKMAHGGISLVFGLSISYFTLLAGSAETNRAKSTFLRLSETVAGGRNVVNTILVDFRAADTLGEIVVLGIAALGVILLLKSRAGTEELK